MAKRKSYVTLILQYGWTPTRKAMRIYDDVERLRYSPGHRRLTSARKRREADKRLREMWQEARGAIPSDVLVSLLREDVWRYRNGVREPWEKTDNAILDDICTVKNGWIV